MSDDTHQWECPGCTLMNDNRLTKCQRCKEPRPDSVVERPTEKPLNPQLCCFVSTRTGKQCPLPGDMSKSCSPKAKRYCLGHFRAQDHVEAEQVYDDIVANLDKIKAEMADDFHKDPVGYFERHKERLAKVAEETAKQYKPSYGGADADHVVYDEEAEIDMEALEEREAIKAESQVQDEQTS